MILVIAEQREGQLNRTSWEAVVAAQQTGQPVKVVVFGASIPNLAEALAGAAVDEVLHVEHDALAQYTADGYASAVAEVVASETPDYVFASHTYQARDFIPKVAARLDRALIADVTAVKPQDAGFVFTRPIFQAKLAADAVPEGPSPHFVTFQAGAYRADQVRRAPAPSPVRAVSVTIAPDAIRQRPDAPFQEARQSVDLTEAERIVSVGRGIKSQEHIDLAARLAKALDGELAASRPICDAGWLPMERQIGSSGQTVAPKLYVALGISGAIQHVVGMKGARTIVAINKDAEAPIFELADYGIVGDLFEIVPAMIAELEKTPGA
jgi:electron transfer flavoprotein alpha subunit